jgi:broad specificity phosphatase PhoE
MFGTKKIYFVRHGQSANNAANVRQGSAGKLSPKGIEQANFVGERFENVHIDIILTSPYERTTETTALINKHLNVPVEESSLLVERKNPTEIIGKDAESLEVKKIMDIIDRSYHKSDFRYSDEENFQDLKYRAKKLLKFLTERNERNIMCVSHRIFLKMVASYIEYGESLTAEQFVKLDFLNKSENASVTLAIYSPWNAWKNKMKNRNLKEQAGWKLLAWNDYGRMVS